MKIISKYKDYYDYLQGIYGVDEKLVLDRRSSEHPTYYSTGRHVFLIGNIRVDVIHIDGKFYCGESDMIKLGGKRHVDVTGRVSYTVSYTTASGRRETISVAVKPMILNSKDSDDRPAIVLLRTGDCYTKQSIYPFPRLEQYNIQKVLSPHDAWVELSAWLGQKVTAREPVVPVGDDKVRILSAGFDLKTSFRH